MDRPKAEWDPSWDEDWQAVLGNLEEEIEDEHPRAPAEAVQYDQYGFSAAYRHPSREWSDVQSEVYQDYMTGAPEPGEPASTNMDWQEASEWAQRGYQAARDYKS